MFERQDLNQIMDAVKQGIVASKESESRFWGDFNDWRKKKDARDDEMHDSLLRLASSFENMAESNKIRNGRIDKLEDKTETLVYWKGGIAVATVLTGAIIGLGIYIFNAEDAKIEKITNQLETHLQK
jgi:hypothetical protein